jgi:hypothetical protein
VDWRERIRKQSDHYRKVAPFYATTRTLLEDCLAVEGDSLSALNVQILHKVCAFLSIRFRPLILSAMNLEMKGIEGAQALAIFLTKSVGASEYVNPPGGGGLYESESFAANGLRLTIKPLVHFPYACGPYPFTPHLSILDVLMWNSPVAIKTYLDSLRLQER